MTIWMQNKSDANWAYVWVKIPRVPGLGTADIYMKYGNPEVSSESSGNHTFLFFDDFSEDLINWIATQTTSNVMINNGELNIRGDGSWNANGVASTRNFTRPFILEWESRVSAYDVDSMEGYSPLPLDYLKGLHIYRAGSDLSRFLDGSGTVLGPQTLHDSMITSKITVKPNQGYSITRNGNLAEDNSAWTGNNHKITFQINFICLTNMRMKQMLWLIIKQLGLKYGGKLRERLHTL